MLSIDWGKMNMFAIIFHQGAGSMTVRGRADNVRDGELEVFAFI